MVEKNQFTVPGSFRDPSGFLFYRNGLLYRQINSTYRENYDHLLDSGLYRKLVEEHLLIPHIEVDIQSFDPDNCYKIIKPEVIQFVSYPYEWCFTQLKHAALTTLKIQKIALDYGMSLKDSSAYNIQFLSSKPVLIDTLSFEKYHEGEPWIAYRQFCQHFLASLSLMSYKDIRLNQLFRIYIDGIPMDLASSLLPFKTNFKFSLFANIHLHAKSQKKYEDKPIKPKINNFSKFRLMALIDNLESAIRKLNWKPYGTVWANYYEYTNYSSKAFQHKKRILREYADILKPASVWDLGANIGEFSRIFVERNILTISFDVDPAAVEKNYQTCLKNKETNLLPLLLDLTNPSPAIGWGNNERMSFIERGPADLVLALALIHHLSISNNVPFSKVAYFFSKICNSLIVEFVPKSDNQVKKMLKTREDIFDKYDKINFENDFQKYFLIKKCSKIDDSNRIMYLMEKKHCD